MYFPKTVSAATHGLQTSRRGLILGSLAAGAALTLGFRVGPAAGQASEGLNPLDVYVRIGDDSSVTIYSAHMDMGQGCYHGIATLVVEELGCDWQQVDVVGGAGNAQAYGNLAWGGAMQGTGGSTAMASSWQRYRVAGAAARTMLIEAAAASWGVPASEIEVDAGMISHRSTGRSGHFGEFAKAAATLSVPDDVVLKTPDTWTEIGRESNRRYDRIGKTTGAEMFTADIRLPDMLTAVPIHPPRFGATLAGFDASEALEVPGVTDVVPMARGIAVVATDTWAAIKGREKVVAQWDESGAETRSSEEILSQYKSFSTSAPAEIARQDGDPDAAFGAADQVIEATYEFPYLAHAALEPLNAVAFRNEEGKVEIAGGHQAPDGYQYGVAGFLGIDPSDVRLTVMKTGGGFGRRAVPDADVVIEAASTAQAIGWRAPVKMQWTREDDMAGGRYRPAYVHRIRAGVAKDGSLLAWDNHIVGQSIFRGTPFDSGGIDPTSVEGASTLPYAISNLRIGLTTTEVGVPVLWWRAVGHTHTAYTNETFLDQVAAISGHDPVAYRLALLQGQTRHARVLTRVAEISGWGRTVPEGHALGVALHESFGSVVAEIADVSLDDTGMPVVHKVWCAVDCGVAINPDVVRAQMEGGIGFGLGAIIAEELTLTDGRVNQLNYDSYTPLRMRQMPEIEVSILDSTNAPTGVGEPGTPPIGPAVANAMRALTGKTPLKLPINSVVM
ncbi:xanthine dehydrogenase family protein molybdopterin-binding subunit [Ruegeria pomeroyi]|uniref:xanthine dehydrogenase family protein molybdopterin-binding subunit n=1 Tax=Ruegeria pomeroyi TaxID=89184 RepID=UPI001F3547F7|nr:xanthine dehydrogenase family protein molybdopterin-binding subunit [Ruegeria pomeroyi]MCE8510940.1 xanthine dehydrogenase family protein molybdopterin-binding subunit [Ruegeria pomeroyi]